MLKLENVTLVAITGVRRQETKKALEYSCREITFGDVLFLSHDKPRMMPEWMRWEQVEPMKNIQAYNRFLLYDLWKYIKTDYALINHYDGFVVHPELWDDRFLDYDYIGAPWPAGNCPPERIDEYGNVCRVGNGVCLRSKRLMEFMDRYQIPFEPYEGTYSEDVLICVKNRHLMEEKGIKFAPVELAAKFCHENDIPEWDSEQPTFMFHDRYGINRKYPKYRMARLMDKFIEKR